MTIPLLLRLFLRLLINILNIVNYLFCFICVFLGVAFFTLLERKLLSYSQLRKGPNKVMFMGLFQPISDAFKLLLKRRKIPFLRNMYFYFFSPFVSLLLMIRLWILYVSSVSFNWLFFGFLFYLCIATMAVYPILGAGWSSNSKYTFIGRIRRLAQILSYEISYIFIILTMLLFILSYRMERFSYNTWFFSAINPIWLLCWICLLVAETNRAPFDFAEGESELVSGFNTEYRRGGFAIIFLSEYGNIIFLSILSSLFLINFLSNFIVIFVFTVLFSSLVVFIRSSYPRFRYDLLMTLAWQILLFLRFLFLCWMILFACI
jgi:NADH-ubiquinone oxidoreductase chain 1